ncbi:hypothetical protein J4H86_03430 [Spiractinospora alimapuensis]|nr:hypothetical protein J4H86_03430 [Spiractinospora alimapuensis]
MQKSALAAVATPSDLVGPSVAVISWAEVPARSKGRTVEVYRTVTSNSRVAVRTRSSIGPTATTTPALCAEPSRTVTRFGPQEWDTASPREDNRT